MAKPKTVYELKISLADIRPPIWRRVEVEDCTLAKLHEIIQIAMGWEGDHLWSFEINGEEYGDDPEGAMEMESARKVKLSQFVRAGIKKFDYVYDFGDNWEHVIEVEKELAPDLRVKYPRCVNGRRACPPEDCGGSWGYADFLDALANPDHEQHEEMLEWIGDKFDPERFELGVLNRELSAVR